jgi:hypothetical protein
MEKPSTATIGARRSAAEAVIHQAADAWSTGSAPFEPSPVLALFLHALSAKVQFHTPSFDHGSTSPWSSNLYGDLPARPFDAWKNAVVSPIEEIRKLAPNISAERADECCGRLMRLMMPAASEWMLGDPENPRTEIIAVALARQLFDDQVYEWWDWRGVRP